MCRGCQIFSYSFVNVCGCIYIYKCILGHHLHIQRHRGDSTLEWQCEELWAHSSQQNKNFIVENYIKQALKPLEIDLRAQNKWRILIRKISVWTVRACSVWIMTPLLFSNNLAWREKKHADGWIQQHRTHHFFSLSKEIFKNASGITVNPGVQGVCTQALGSTHLRVIRAGNGAHVKVFSKHTQSNQSREHLSLPQRLKLNFWPDLS